MRENYYLKLDAEIHRLQAENQRLIESEREMSVHAVTLQAKYDDVCQKWHAAVDEKTELQRAAQAVIDRWETPLWKDAPATATFIYALRDAVKGK